jgi:LuxR family maltose regulon positive regulatory protein
MSKLPLHMLTWSEEQHLYELYTQGQLEQRFRSVEQATWLAWLDEATSFAFHGASGNLNVYQEARPRGGLYWYAYHTIKRRTHKRYLGSSAQLTFARLEETAQALARTSTPVSPSASPMRSPAGQTLLFFSKLAPPRLPHALVERERLLSVLEGALSTPLTLLAASAGWGKTTLLATWASRHTAQVAWLSLDELDNSPPRFWIALIAALRRCGRFGPSFGETVVALLSSPQPPPLAACLSALLQELESHEALSAPLVLILDDYHLVTDPALHESLSFILEHLPTHLHLILSSRVDPDLPLSRLRARGHLTELRADELRFHLEEASHYLGQILSPLLSEDELQRLVNRTEGWIAGLQLAALALQKRADRAAFLQVLSGSQRYLLDYVQEEILGRLPERVRDFLLHTAILSRLDTSVCQAVTAAPERRTCQQMLVFLERANLFLVPLDEERHWYRLHDLFREALLACLQTTQPELVPLLHRRAASFYEVRGEWTEALAHWFSARDFSTAANLMEQTVEQFWVRGEGATIARWVLALPDPLVRKHARLLLTTALYLLATGFNTAQEQRESHHQEVRRLMARVEMALRDHLDETRLQESATEADAGTAFSSEDVEANASEDALLRRRLRLLHMYLVLNEAGASGDFERLSRMQQEIEEELERDEEVIWQMVPLACSFMLHYTVRREGASLVPKLLSAKERASESANPFATIAFWELLALAAVRAGQLRLAYEESQMARTVIEQLAGYALLKGYFEIAQIEALYQWNRLEEARDLLQTIVHDAAAWQQLDLLGWAYADLMRVEIARGAWSAAEQALHEVEQLVQRERFGTYPGWLPALRADFWQAQGRLREASDWATGIVFPEEPWGPGSYSAFPVVIRVYFAERRWTEALDLLESFRGHLDRPVNLEVTIPYLSQLLVALHQTGQSEQARKVAARLFALTEPEGYLRVYLDLGEPMQQTLKELLASPSNAPPDAVSASFSRSYVVQLLAAFEQEESLTAIQTANAGRSFALTQESLPSPVEGRPSRMELLSPQEVKVLRLLVAGRTYAEMAESLVVSIHTIKTQVSSIYRKLGVSRRAEAIAASRQFHLL